MDLKKIVLIVAVVLIASLTISMVSADDSYSISQANIDLIVSNNGMLHVKEAFVYNFQGTFNGVYRDVPLKEGENISNIKVHADGAYPVLKQTDEDGKKHLQIYLYADEGHTKKISDCSVTVYIEYDLKNVVTVFNDVSALQYKVLGSEWDVDIGKVTGHVKLPNGTGNEFYLNPKALTQSSSMNGDKIEFTSNSISKGKIYELLVLMPVNDFATSPNAKHVDEDGREMILKNMNDSTNSENFWNGLTSILEIISLAFLPLTLIVTYILYGREPKVDYDRIYEREPPTDDPPSVVNAMIDNKNFGEPNIRGFEATIMDLIDRKVFNIKKDNEDLLMTFNEGADNLDYGEKIVYNCLSGFASDGVLNLSELDDKMDSRVNSLRFVNQFDMWKEAVEMEYLNDDIKDRYFDDRGNTIAGFAALAGLAVAAIFAAIFLFFEFSRGFELFIVGLIVGAASFGILYLRDDLFGRWTKEGRVIYLKWKNFKKFLNDNSLINEHPPESIVIWKEYLIYGTALGVAKNVEKAMDIHVPSVDRYDGGVFMYHHYGSNTFYHCYGTASSNTSSSSSGSDSFGSFGGGSGGGGGGAF